MHGDVALDGRQALMPHSTLQGDANLLVLPNIDAANIAYNLLKPPPAATSPSARCCWARPNLCTFSRPAPPCAASST
jgi:hypothetical protein